jgi:DNA replication protein DnaC
LTSVSSRRWTGAIETLATCAWIREGFTLLLQGPPGVGKTYLAVALGVKAVENGFSVAFFRLEELLLALAGQPDPGGKA